MNFFKRVQSSSLNRSIFHQLISEQYKQDIHRFVYKINTSNYGNIKIPFNSPKNQVSEYNTFSNNLWETQNNASKENSLFISSRTLFCPPDDKIDSPTKKNKDEPNICGKKNCEKCGKSDCTCEQNSCVKCEKGKSRWSSASTSTGSNSCSKKLCEQCKKTDCNCNKKSGPCGTKSPEGSAKKSDICGTKSSEASAKKSDQSCGCGNPNCTCGASKKGQAKTCTCGKSNCSCGKKPNKKDSQTCARRKRCSCGKPNCDCGKKTVSSGGDELKKSLTNIGVAAKKSLTNILSASCKESQNLFNEGKKLLSSGGSGDGKGGGSQCPTCGNSSALARIGSVAIALLSLTAKAVINIATTIFNETMTLAKAIWAEGIFGKIFNLIKGKVKT